MSKGYWMVSVTIADAERYKRYIESNASAFEKYGAKFLARGGRFASPEVPTGTRNAIIEFESYERALACYNSPEYQSALKHRLASSVAHTVIVEGVE